MHSIHHRVGIFNGLGAKGALLAPYFAHHLVRHLIYGTGLIKEVDVSHLQIN
jgi:hypothetical protein